MRAEHWLLLGLLTLLGVRLVAISRESINWDEFALFARAVETLRTGEIQGGGRPGLATLVLLPLVEGCESAIAAIQRGRWIWTGVTVGLVAGFWTLLSAWLRRERAEDRPWRGAAVGVALLVLVPVFLRWSIHVRTDQPAVMLGLWGGVALLASARRPAWALAAGGLFGAGFLFSQKLVYVAALAGLLALARIWIDRDVRLGRELIRVGLTGTGFAFVIALFDQWVARAWGSATMIPGGGLGAFEFYRQTMNYSVYLGMLPSLLPHILVALVIVGLVASGRHRRLENRKRLTAALAVLALGGAVGLFHAGAFPYFWMTLGLFPAAAAVVALPALREGLGDRTFGAAAAAVAVALFLASGLAGASILRDSQAVQHETLAFIDRHLPDDARGFHPESALFCRGDPKPFPTFFSQTIRARFTGPDGLRNEEAFLSELENRPVAFVVDSWRLGEFPPRIIHRFEGSYVPYAFALLVAGRAVPPGDPGALRFEVFSPGEYRWWPADDDAVTALIVDGVPVEPGGSIHFEAGVHEVRLETPGEGGIFALELEVAPQPETVQPFFQGGALKEFEGWRLPHWQQREP